jgi:hypothetical protein
VIILPQQLPLLLSSLLYIIHIYSTIITVLFVVDLKHRGVCVTYVQVFAHTLGDISSTASNEHLRIKC